MFLILSSKQLVGWDTPAYVHYSGVLKQSGLNAFLTKTYYGSNGVLYYFLMVFLNNVFGYSLFFIDKLLASLLYGGLCVVSSVIIYTWKYKISYALLALGISIIWPGPYILASNLHSNELGLLFGMFAVAIIPKAIVSGGKYLFFSIVLLFLTSLAHPQTGALTGFILVCLMCVLVGLNRKQKLTGILRLSLMAGISFSLLLFSTIMLGQPRVVGPVFALSQNLEAQLNCIDPIWAIKLLGHTLFPMLIISLSMLILVLIRSHIENLDESRIGLLFLMLWSTLSVLLWLMSYQWLTFVTYAERLLVIFPVPLVLVLGVKYLLEFRVKE